MATCLTCVLAVAVNAAEGETKKEGEAKKKASPAAELKAARKELVEKYDANKNGRLNKEEISKMTPADLEKWNSLSPAPKKKTGEPEKK